MIEKFAWNGVPLDRVSEPVVERELAKSRDADIAVPCLLAVLGAFFAATILDVVVADDSAKNFGFSLLAFSTFVGVFAAGRGFLLKAQEADRLPSDQNAVPPPTHVSGLGAAIIVGIAFCLGTAAYFGQSSNGSIRIPEWLGLSVVVIFCALFTWIFLISRIFDVSSLRGAQRVLERLFVPFVPLGRLFSQLDALLVFVLAPIFGTTLSNSMLRYLVLFGHLVGGTVFAWIAPAPLGLLGSVWALSGIVSVSRRWSWIETERNRTLLDPEVRKSDLRISVDDDLRDEAILGLLLLVLVLPIAMRQVHLWTPSTPVFLVDPVSTNRLDAWVGFFGVELLKALPFLDWADVYDAQAVTRVESSSAISMHLVLIARALLDLLFISALFQSISISVSLAKNRSDFLNQRAGVDKLDPRIEIRELTSLAYKTKSTWSFRPEIQAFSHYNLRRLSRVRLRAPHGSRLRAAIDRILWLSNRSVVPPAEQLVNVTSAKRIDAKELSSALAEVADAQDYDLPFLAMARRQLNRKGGMEVERKKIVQMIISNVPHSPEREIELAQILQGQDADSLANIRVLAIAPLARNSAIYPKNRVVLSLALRSDRSKVVRERAKVEMRRYGVQPVVIEESAFDEIA